MTNRERNYYPKETRGYPENLFEWEPDNRPLEEYCEAHPIAAAAWNLARRSHLNQTRKDGTTPYINHPEAIAKMALSLQLGRDELMIAAILLHDVIEDSETITSKELLRAALLREIGNFDKTTQDYVYEIAAMVDAVSKVTLMSQDRKDKDLETIKKLFDQTQLDTRPLVIKLLDRLHNMSTLDTLPSEKQILKAQETLDVYVPLARDMGINALADQLEQLSLNYLPIVSFGERLLQIQSQQFHPTDHPQDFVVDLLQESLVTSGDSITITSVKNGVVIGKNGVTHLVMSPDALEEYLWGDIGALRQGEQPTNPKRVAVLYQVPVTTTIDDLRVARETGSPINPNKLVTKLQLLPNNSSIVDWLIRCFPKTWHQIESVQINGKLIPNNAFFESITDPCCTIEPNWNPTFYLTKFDPDQVALDSSRKAIESMNLVIDFQNSLTTGKTEMNSYLRRMGLPRLSSLMTILDDVYEENPFRRHILESGFSSLEGFLNTITFQGPGSGWKSLDKVVNDVKSLLRSHGAFTFSFEGNNRPLFIEKLMNLVRQIQGDTKFLAAVVSAKTGKFSLDVLIDSKLNPSDDDLAEQVRFIQRIIDLLNTTLAGEEELTSQTSLTAADQ